MPYSLKNVVRKSDFLSENDLFRLGMMGPNRFDEFSENFQTASDPPYFRETILRFFREAQKFATKFIRIGVTPPPFSEN